MASEFLLEIGTEEIPDWMLGGALADLKKRFLAVLEEQQRCCAEGCRNTP